MAEVNPLKLVDQGGGVGALAEFGIGDTLPADNLPANVASLAGLTGAADRLPYFTGAGALSLATLTSLARTLLDDTTQSGMQSTLGLGTASTRTALGTTGALYSRDSILGTVSQSGGVPTGAIIERGSNANGEYVRYADGTQICWGLLTFAGSWGVATNFVSSTAGAVYFADVLVTHPAAFATAPVSVATVKTGSAWGVRGVSSNTITHSFQIYSGSAATVEIAFLTVGRWL